MKIYSVKSTVLPEKLSTRLIRAENASQAIRFATSGFYQVSLASQDELVALATNGVAVENAVSEVKGQ